ncbi:MAG: FtsW/RodA/SpoVE family cell cycle protein [Candidatus Paceibacterota bacterium]|jgi:cell division protein FtsW
MFLKSRKSGHNPDYFLMALFFVLVIFGLAMIASASSELGKIKFNDTYYFLKHQILSGLLIGLIGLVLAYKINYHLYKKFALPFLIGSICLLALVFTKFGVASGGASRWLQFGSLQFQPAELLKLTFILYLAAWLSNSKINRKGKFIEGMLPFLVIVGVISVLLLLQPATSIVVILIGSALIIYFTSGAKFKYFAVLLGLGVAVLGLIVIFTPYRLTRIMTFLNLKNDNLGSNYHVNEAKIAIGSGGIFGVGYGESKTKASRLPAPIDDSIFAVTGEELGFVGSGSLVVVFGLLVFRLLMVAKNLSDRFGQYLLIGFASIIGIQSIINIGAISGLFPLTGIPLPFISYGGTAMAVFLTMAGISMNISRFTYH